MRRWVATVAAALAGVLVVTGLPAIAPGGTPDSVTAVPQEGDTARYTGYETVEVDGSVVENTSLEWAKTWTVATEQLSDGSTWTGPTLDYRFPQPDGPAEDGASLVPAPQVDRWTRLLGAGEDDSPRVEVSVTGLAYGYPELPGEYQRFGYKILDQHTEGDFWRVFRLDGRTSDFCAFETLGPLAGQAPEAALDASRACLAENPWGTTRSITVDARWEEHPRWGLTWVRTADVAYTTAEGRPAQATFTIRTSPTVSMELERRMTWVTEGVDGPRQHVRHVTMTGWTAGDDPLPDGDPMPETPTIGLIDWSEQGPQDAWSPQLGFAEARQAVDQTDEAQAYHEEHPEAQLTLARYIARHADEHASPATSSANLAKCEDPLVPSPSALTGPRMTEEAWSFFVSGDDEDMIGQAHEPRAPERLTELGADPPEQTSVSRFASAGPVRGFELPARGPSIADLLDQVTLADELGAHGDPFAAAIVPANASATANPTGYPLDGIAGRVACTYNPAFGYAYEETGVVFQNARATGHYTIRVEAVADAPIASTGLSSPPSHDAGGGLEEITGLSLAGVALASGALSVVGGRWLSGLYSRLTSRDLLEHPVRTQLHDVAHEQPGVTLTELSERIDKHRSTLEYHLRRLDREGLLDVASTSSGVVAFPSGHPLVDHADVLAKGQARELVQLVRRSPGRNLSAYADDLGVSKGYVSRLARQLAEAGLIERTRSGRELLLSTGPLSESL